MGSDVEREDSVATDLRQIVNRLPNDLITKWQTKNYHIVSRGRTAQMRKDQKRGRQFAENTLKDKKNGGASNQDNSPAVNSSRQQEVPLDNGQWSSVAPKGPGSFERSSEHMGKRSVYLNVFISGQWLH